MGIKTDINRVVDLIFELLDELDIEELEEMSYIGLANFWCEQIRNNVTGEEELKAALKQYLRGDGAYGVQS